MLALSRLMIVINPLHTTFKNFRHVFGFAIVIYTLSFIFTVFVTLYLKFNENILPTNLCLPFIDPTNSIIILKIWIWYVVCSQYATSLFIAICYIMLMSRLTKHQKKLGKTKWIKNANVSLLLQLIVVTFSNIICWFPANAIFITAMFVRTYPVYLVTCMIVFVLPLNSIINPIVFISTYFRKFQKILKAK